MDCAKPFSPVDRGIGSLEGRWTVALARMRALADASLQLFAQAGCRTQRREPVSTKSTMITNQLGRKNARKWQTLGVGPPSNMSSFGFEVDFCAESRDDT